MMGDFAAALPDLERVVASDSTYDFHRAAGLLAHAYANTGQPEKAEALFRQVTKISTSIRDLLQLRRFLASQQRNAEAREWARQILAKKPTMPGYLRRRERPWFRKANALLKRLPELRTENQKLTSENKKPENVDRGAKPSARDAKLPTCPASPIWSAPNVVHISTPSSRRRFVRMTAECCMFAITWKT